MPVYPGGGQATLLYENRKAFLFNKEPIVAGQASVAVQLRRTRGDSYPFGASFEISFDGAPGAFQVDIQTSDTDTPNTWVTINSVAGGLNASNVGRVELPNFWATFTRVKVISLANAVNTTVLVSR